MITIATKEFDARYEYRTCTTCGNTHQRIDFRGSLHAFQCDRPDEAPACDLADPTARLPYYQKEIRRILDASGYAGKYDPRHVEGYMRLEHATLNGLADWQFRNEVEISRQCIDVAGVKAAERNAKSFGL